MVLTKWFGPDRSASDYLSALAKTASKWRISTLVSIPQRRGSLSRSLASSRRRLPMTWGGRDSLRFSWAGHRRRPTPSFAPCWILLVMFNFHRPFFLFVHLLSFFSISRFSLIYVFGLRTRGLIGWAPFSLEYRGGGYACYRWRGYITAWGVVGVVSIFALAFSTIDILFRIIIHCHFSLSSFIIHNHM